MQKLAKIEAKSRANLKAEKGKLAAPMSGAAAIGGQVEAMELQWAEAKKETKIANQ